MCHRCDPKKQGWGEKKEKINRPQEIKQYSQGWEVTKGWSPESAPAIWSLRGNFKFNLECQKQQKGLRNWEQEEEGPFSAHFIHFCVVWVCYNKHVIEK